MPATEGTEISLARLPGRSLVIVYPWTGRPGKPNPPNWDEISGAHGSTPELERFRDLAGDFAELGVALYALSTQTTDYQREMAQRLRLTFPVLSDFAWGFSHSLRLPSFVVSTEVLFALPDERLSIRHDAGGTPVPYVGGTLLAVRAVVGRVGLTRGLDHLLE